MPHGADHAVGLFQIRQLDPSFEVAEWGFALAQPFWGTGVFAATAPAIVDFAIETIGVTRLEARASVRNGRGNGALQKIGAVREARLRKSFLKDGEYHDQLLWTISADELAVSAAAGPRHGPLTDRRVCRAMSPGSRHPASLFTRRNESARRWFGAAASRGSVPDRC